MPEIPFGQGVAPEMGGDEPEATSVLPFLMPQFFQYLTPEAVSRLSEIPFRMDPDLWYQGFSGMYQNLDVSGPAISLAPQGFADPEVRSGMLPGQSYGHTSAQHEALHALDSRFGDYRLIEEREQLEFPEPVNQILEFLGVNRARVSEDMYKRLATEYSGPFNVVEIFPMAAELASFIPSEIDPSIKSRFSGVFTEGSLNALPRKAKRRPGAPKTSAAERARII